HAGDDPFGEHLENQRERIALRVARCAGRKLFFRTGNAHAGKDVECFLAAAVCREVARRFRQPESEEPHNECANSDDDPYPTPADRFTEVKREKGRNRPHAGAADEVNEGEYPAADRFRRIFAGIGESERLFAAETQTTDKPAHHQPEYGWRERAEDCEDSEQEQIELVDGLASPPVAEF